MTELNWQEKELDPITVLLDWNNPRVEGFKASTQPELIEKLVTSEDIVDLAKEIISFGGLMPGERIIVCKEKGAYVVLEGNRRICAIQLLLNQKLIPTEFKKHFPKAPPKVKEALASVKADVAPNRDAAEATITKRHTEPGIHKWNTVAKMRRASRLLEEGMTLDQISEKLGASKSAIQKSVREYRLLKYALDLKGWSAEERAILSSNNLATNPYTRFFTLAGVKPKLKLSFDEKDFVHTGLEKAEFDKWMEHIARSFLIPTATGKPAKNTRTEPDEIFGTGSPKDPKKKKVQKAKIRPAKPADFMENLVCTVEDQSLILITNELNTIDHNNHPIAAAMLLRALLELALRYKVKQSKKMHEFQKGAHADKGLKELIKFCSNHGNNVFKEKRAADMLANFEKEAYKDALDAISHAKWQEADPKLLERAAKVLRPLLSHIIDKNEPEEGNP